jgi:chromosome segregation ATPase
MTIAPATVRHGAALALPEAEAERRWQDLDTRTKSKLCALEGTARALAATVRSLQARRRDLQNQIARTEHELRDVEQARRDGVTVGPDRTNRARTLPEPRPETTARKTRLDDEAARVAAELTSTETALAAARRVAANCRRHLGLPPEVLG